MGSARHQAEAALYPDLLWSRPLNARSAGRILLVGGHSGSIAQLQALYQLIDAAGVGEVRIAAPDVQSKLLGPLGIADFLPSTPSGSIAKGAYGQLLYLAEEVDSVVIGADLTANSETALVIEKFLRESPTRVVLLNEAVDAARYAPEICVQRPGTLIVTDMARLAWLMPQAAEEVPAGSIDQRKAGLVSSFVQSAKADLLLVGNNLIAGYRGAQPIITDLPSGHMAQRLPVAAALAAALWTQHQAKPVEALATASYLAAAALGSLDAVSTATVQQVVTAVRKTVRSSEDSNW